MTEETPPLDLPPVTIDELVIGPQWRFGEMRWEGLVYPVLSICDPRFGWRHYLLKRDELDTLGRCLAALTEPSVN